MTTTEPPGTKQYPPYLTVPQVQELTQLSRGQVYRLIERYTELAALEITDGIDVSRMPELLHGVRASVTRAAEVLAQFPDKVRSDLLMRIATMETGNPAALQELNKIVEGELSGSGLQQGHFLGGVKFAADIMNNFESAAEQQLMDHIKEADESLGNRIQDLMFVFDDLKNVDDQGIQALLREVSSDGLVLALKAADDELKQKVFGNMSKRAGELLRDDLEARGPVRVSEVENAQREILAVARRMADAGEIALGASAEAMI